MAISTRARDSFVHHTQTAIPACLGPTHHACCSMHTQRQWLLQQYTCEQRARAHAPARCQAFTMPRVISHDAFHHTIKPETVAAAKVPPRHAWSSLQWYPDTVPHLCVWHTPCMHAEPLNLVPAFAKQQPVLQDTLTKDDWGHVMLPGLPETWHLWPASHHTRMHACNPVQVSKLPLEQAAAANEHMHFIQKKGQTVVTN